MSAATVQMGMGHSAKYGATAIPRADALAQKQLRLKPIGNVVERVGPQCAEAAATGTEALIAEGANRYTPKQKRQRFVEARGEAGEVAAHLERLFRFGYINEDELMTGLGLADRVCATLTGLIKRHS